MLLFSIFNKCLNAQNACQNSEDPDQTAHSGKGTVEEIKVLFLDIILLHCQPDNQLLTKYSPKTMFNSMSFQCKSLLFQSLNFKDKIGCSPSIKSLSFFIIAWPGLFYSVVSYELFVKMFLESPK